MSLNIALSSSIEAEAADRSGGLSREAKGGEVSYSQRPRQQPSLFLSTPTGSPLLLPRGKEDVFSPLSSLSHSLLSPSSSSGESAS